MTQEINNKYRRELIGITRGFKNFFVILFFCIFLIIYIFGYFFYDIQRIKGKELLVSIDNPSGSYTAQAYLTGGGATTDYGIIVTIKNNITKSYKNIYWNYPQSEVSMIWCDDFTIKINN